MKLAGGTIRVLVDLDVGHGRCGTTISGATELVRIIKQESQHLIFGGIHAYQGSVQHIRDWKERESKVQEAARVVKKAKELLELEYGESVFVTGGGTGSMCFDVLQGVWNELQPGSYIFGDVDYGLNDWGPGYLFEQSFFIHTQVMSVSDDRAVVDAGNKSHSLDAGVAPTFCNSQFGWNSGGDEHGILSVLPEFKESVSLPNIGEVLAMIPGHIDPTVNMYDAIYGYRADTVTEVIAIDARGRSD